MSHYLCLRGTSAICRSSKFSFTEEGTLSYDGATILKGRCQESTIDAIRNQLTSKQTAKCARLNVKPDVICDISIAKSVILLLLSEPLQVDDAI